jgi:hypothetical protein
VTGFVVCVPALLAHVAKHVVQAKTIRPFFADRMSLVTGVATKPAILSQTGRVVAERVASRRVRPACVLPLRFRRQTIARPVPVRNGHLGPIDLVERRDSLPLAQLVAELHRVQPHDLLHGVPVGRLARNPILPSAIDNFFTKIKYEKVVDDGNEKKILFNKNGNYVSIDTLSTGEKQIVFRGSYLLRNSNQLNGAAIMVDEPELSVHPKWQKNILKYYKDLFTQNNQQVAQIFMATHSEYVLEDALNNDDKNLTIIINDVNGVIQAKRIDAPSVLPSIMSAETNYLAFDIVSNDYHIELYGWLQQRESRFTVKSCDDFIKNHQLYIPAVHGKGSSFGATTYDTLSTFIRNAIDHPGPGQTFTERELRSSTELLIQLCT